MHAAGLIAFIFPQYLGWKENGARERMMKTFKKATRIHFWWIWLLIIFPSCRFMPWIAGEKPLQIQEGIETEWAQSVFLSLKNRNQALKSFKGIGKLTLRENNRVTVDERAAWICSQPAKLSMALMAGGQPVVRIASDGEWLYYRGYADNQMEFRKFRTSDPSLDKLIAVPLKTSDVIALLAGRIPHPEYYSAVFTKNDHTDEYILLLVQWSGKYKKVFLSADGADIRKIEYYSFGDVWLFTVNFNEMQLVKGYRVPRSISIIDDTGEIFRLRIDRYIADAMVSPSMFVLKPAGEKGNAEER